tara:strand:+ start:27 stop:1202 length:1176 start_codon:yes stop_codon:yes gene_type:complete
MALKQNTWKLNQWYDQNVAGNVSYTGQNQLWSWGHNDKGNLGHNNRTNYSSPKQVGSGADWAVLDRSNTGGKMSAAIKTDGTLWLWGNNNDGDLGLNDVVLRSSPTQIPGTTWAAVSSRGPDDGYMASKTDGTLWVWGENYNGGLGLNQSLGSLDRVSSPVQLPGTNWSTNPVHYATGGGGRAAAIKTDGSLWVWGDGNYGRLGLNDYPASGPRRRSSPTQLTSATNWKNISAGPGQLLMVNTSGEMYMYGDGTNGILAQNDTINYSSPTQIPGTTWNKVAVSGYCGYAIKTDGTLWAWGYNNNGDLAQNDRIYRSSPVQIPGTTWNDIEGGNSWALATKTDGSLWAWGYSYSYGHLGLNDMTHRSSPTQIPGTWGSVTTKYDHALGLKIL